MFWEGKKKRERLECNAMSILSPAGNLSSLPHLVYSRPFYLLSHALHVHHLSHTLTHTQRKRDSHSSLLVSRSLISLSFSSSSRHQAPIVCLVPSFIASFFPVGNGTMITRSFQRRFYSSLSLSLYFLPLAQRMSSP